jgi:hypothetical protein
MDDDAQRPLIDFGALTWSPDDTKDYLDDNPLPVGFTWKHKDGGLRPVQPSYSVPSYGKWLRETPNFQGLFEEIHRIIVHAGVKLPDAQQVAAELLKRHPQRQFNR